MMVREMSVEALQQQSTSGTNIFHMAASRGNKFFLHVALPLCKEKMGEEVALICYF